MSAKHLTYDEIERRIAANSALRNQVHDTMMGPGGDPMHPAVSPFSPQWEELGARYDALAAESDALYAEITRRDREAVNA